MKIPITLWPSLRAVDDPRPYELTWEEILELFQHREYQDKAQAPGFGPYECLPPPGRCFHARGVVEGAHRCDACVESLSMVVLDVDTGMWPQVQACEDWLSDAGIYRLWHSSWSFSGKQRKPSLRLIIPLAEPVSGKLWSSFREKVIQKFAVPADPRKCGGRSHFYYLPSHPPGANETLLTSSGGRFFHPDEVGAIPDSRATPRELSSMLVDWEPLEGGSGAVDLSAYREAIREEAKRLGRRANEHHRYRSRVLMNLVSGKALAEKGDRDNATTRAAMAAVNILPPEATVRELEMLFQDSLQAMQHAGSRQDVHSVRRKIVSAMRKRIERETAEAEFLKQVLKSQENIPQIPWVGGRS